MDFFKSVFADDQPPSDSDATQPEDQHEVVEEEDDSGLEPNPNDPNTTGSDTAWSFGGLIKTLATKSESVIQNYSRDFKDFGNELKKETSTIREVASRAFKDLPSFEVGASVVQESLESVGQAIDDIGSTVWKSTAGIIAHGRETLLAADLDSDHSDINIGDIKQLSSSSSRSLEFKTYSRFEAQVRRIQSNKNTYMEEPEDLNNYEEWKSGFSLDEKKEEIENLIAGKETIGEIYGNLVPDKTEHENFWYRYFYRVHRLKEVEDARAKLVKRAISGEEEDLSWDVDEDNSSGSASKVSSSGNAELEKQSCSGDEEAVAAKKQNDSECIERSDGDDRDKKFEEGKTESRDSSCRDSDVSIVSRPDEEDLGWDEIEEIGSSDDSKGGVDAAFVGSANRADLRKRLSAAGEDEDLSWDIEDDDDDDDNGKNGAVKSLI